MIRKHTSLLLIAVLLAHLAGFYVYFVVRLGEVRMSMREKLSLVPDEQLDVVRIPAAAFRSRWIDEREMKWQGRMYDIARVERAGDEIIVYCLHDEDEDGLLNFIGAVVDMAHQDTKPAPAPVVQFLALKYVINQAVVLSPGRTTSPDYVLPTSLGAYSFFPESLTPPPRA